MAPGKLRNPRSSRSLFARAVDTERIYFELGAKIHQLPGAQLSWMEGLTASPAATVIHRVRPEICAANGVSWTAEIETALATIGAGMARIYLDQSDSALDRLLLRAGYVAREELIFVHSLPEPLPGLTLSLVATDADWRRKLLLHEAVESSPDGHRTSAAQWVELERRKCAHGMECYLAMIDGETVGAVGAIWGDRLLRMKNVVVHPAHRRRSIGREMLCEIAALGRKHGIVEQCVLAVAGTPGELLYRDAGMRVEGTLVEWSKRIEGAAS